MITVCQIKVFASTKKEQKPPDEKKISHQRGKKRIRSGVKQSPGSETGQVKESGETIVLLREEHSRESSDQIKWSLLRHGRC